MSADKLDIYRWDRFSKPRVYSRSQRVTSDDDIQGWIKKVEAASNRAAEVALGSEYPATSRAASRHSAKSAVDNVLTEDAAHTEAQELLQQWMTDKMGFDDNFGEDENDETWAKPRKTQSEIKKEWDHLLEMHDPSYHSSYPDGPLTPKSSGRSSSRSKDPYSILNEDSNDVVDDILQNMLEKDFVSDYVTKDLGFTEKKGQDPRTKMKLRQQKVKENREKRMKELERQRRDKQTKKEAEFRARQQMKQEELRKAEVAKKEEVEIKREMARIRKEMEDDRKKHEEQKLRERKEAEERDRLAREEFEREIAEEQSAQQRLFQRDETKKRKIMERMKMIQQREAIQNFKILQRSFNAWYDLVLAKRLKMGKARAMSDWKCLVRAWNGWKSYVRDKHLEREAHRHKHDVIMTQRKQQMSTQHYQRTLLLKCWLAWQHYVSLERQRKDVHAEQDVTRNKMASFLQAAASGHLWAKEESDINEANGQGPTSQALDHMFAQGQKPVQGRVDSARSDLSTGRSQGSKSSSKVPTEAFQVKREHIKLIKVPGQSGDGTARSNEEETEEEESARNHSRKNSWKKPPFVANNMEHRHNAQQKMLEQQQVQIKEQQKLIEELTYLQKQQLAQQQLTTQALLQQQLDKGVAAAMETESSSNKAQAVSQNNKTARKNVPKMANHLDKLQKDLVIEGDLSTARNDSHRAAPNRTVQTNRTDTSRTVASTARTTSSIGSGTARTNRTNPKHEQFLQAMEDRAAERDKLKRAREEKKRKEEEEKLAILLAQEAEKKEKEEEEKRKRIETHREKKRLEKERELERQKELERLRELTEKADEHSRLATLRYRGWLRWRRLIQMRRDKEAKAKEHYKQAQMRKCLVSWHHTVASELHGKRTMADDMFNYILIRRCFYNWRRVGETTQILEAKAQRHYERRLQLKVIQEWADVTAGEKVARWHRERQAKEHNIMRIKRKAFVALRDFPRFVREEKDKEKRRTEMRKKVASMLPDYELSRSTRSSITSSIGDL